MLLVLQFNYVLRHEPYLHLVEAHYVAHGQIVGTVVTGLIGWAAIVINSAEADISSNEWLALGVAVAVALGVYAVPNDT